MPFYHKHHMDKIRELQEHLKATLFSCGVKNPAMLSEGINALIMAHVEATMAASAQENKKVDEDSEN